MDNFEVCLLRYFKLLTENFVTISRKIIFIRNQMGTFIKNSSHFFFQHNVEITNDKPGSCRVIHAFEVTHNQSNIKNNIFKDHSE